MPRNIVRHLLIWFSVLVLLSLLGAAGYMWLEGWSFPDSLYMVVITLTTVGYREIGEMGHPAQFWTMGLAISGIGMIGGSIGLIVEEILSDVTIEKRKARAMTKTIEQSRDHFIVCGYGRVGSLVARELFEEGHAVVVVDIRPESLAKAQEEGFPIVPGDGTSDDVLQQAGIERARGLICSMDSDTNNVYVTLSARALNPKLIIVGRAGVEGVSRKLLQAGADRVVSPYAIAGRRIAAMAIRPEVMDFFDAALSHGDLSFSIEEIEVSPGGRLEGQRVGSLRADGIFTLAIIPQGGRYQANPYDDRLVCAGEKLIVSGSAETIRTFSESGRPAH